MLTISSGVIDDMVEHALAEDPNECCGLIAGSDSTAERGYRITNTAKSPFRYLMDPQEFLNADRDAEGRGLSLVAFYHSHTHSAAYPSDTDVRMAVESGWLDPYYVLVSLANNEKGGSDEARPDARMFRITEDGRIGAPACRCA